MNAVPAILAIDQGTSSTKAVVIGAQGQVLGKTSVKIARHDPKPGYVEQDAAEILQSVRIAIDRVLSGIDVRILGLGLSNQRESAVIWDRRTGQPLGPVLGWQDRRTSAIVAKHEADGLGAIIQEKTGLPLDPMFSALKLQWLLDQVDPDRRAAKRGDIAIGTIDSWLISQLTGEHRIETGNASRTQLLNLHTMTWDPELLQEFRIPEQCLPRIAGSGEPSKPIVGVDKLAPDTRFHGVLGDSHAALFAQGVREAGAVKATYGSGNSIMGLEGSAKSHPLSFGLARTVAWQLDEPVYALEGTVLSTGATVLWLSELLGVEPEVLSELAQSTPDSQGVDLVPAFAGIGAPWWDDKAVASLSGFGLGTSRPQIARAAFDSIVLQTEDVFAAMERCTGQTISTVLVDGGPTQNPWLMQLQADMSQRTVVRNEIAELSASGAAYLAGIGCELWSSEIENSIAKTTTTFSPQITSVMAATRQNTWHSALARARLRPEHSNETHKLLRS